MCYMYFTWVLIKHNTVTKITDSLQKKIKKRYRRPLKCIRIWLKGRWQEVVIEKKKHVGRILRVSSSRSVPSLRMGIMEQNSFDIFWSTDTKQSVLMKFVRTHIRIQTWIMKPCRKMDWRSGPNSTAQCARTSTCGLLTRGGVVQVAITV